MHTHMYIYIYICMRAVLILSTGDMCDIDVLLHFMAAEFSRPRTICGSVLKALQSTLGVQVCIWMQLSFRGPAQFAVQFLKRCKAHSVSKVAVQFLKRCKAHSVSKVAKSAFECSCILRDMCWIALDGMCESILLPPLLWHRHRGEVVQSPCEKTSKMQ